MRLQIIFPAFLVALMILLGLLCCLNTHSTAARKNQKPCQQQQENRDSFGLRQRREVNTYYDFLINEWSFKFWAVFQLVTIAVLFYSTFAAIYYAKYTYLHTAPTDDDIDFWKRSLEDGTARWGEG